MGSRRDATLVPAGGTHAYASLPRTPGPDTTLRSALTLPGIGPARVERATTSEASAASVAQGRLSWLRPRPITILDSISAHTGERVRKWIKSAGPLPGPRPGFAA